MKQNAALSSCLILYLTVLACRPVVADVVHVDGPEQLTKSVAAATPGDEIIIDDDVWQDAKVRIVGNGSETAPIRIHPATPGGLEITGESRVRIGGSHLVLSGLEMRNIRCRESLVIGYADKDSPEATGAPNDCLFRGNALLAEDKRTAIAVHHVARNTRWESNLVTGGALGIDLPESGGIDYRQGDPPSEIVPPPPDLSFVESVGPSWGDK